MTKKEFYAEVLAEVEHIKKVATPEEIERLDFDSLNPFAASECIYGQMTGKCWSERAKNLQPKKFTHLPGSWGNGRTFKECHFEINHFEDVNYTSLEVYIALKGAKNKSLIQYLKGEIKTWKP